jgi:hypothetical protein
MDVTRYVEGLRGQFAAVAGIGGPETAALAERLADALDSAVRLAIQAAVCDAAEEITRDLAPGSVEVRLRSDDLDFVVTAPSGASDDATMAPSRPTTGQSARAPESGEVAETGTARINFRPPEALKARIEEAAERAGQSVNGFLVAVVTAALDPAAAPQIRRGEAVSGWYA